MSGFESLDEGDVSRLEGPRSSLSSALPCQFALERGKGVLQGLAHQPSLFVSDGVDGLDGLGRRPRVKLHRSAGAIDARRPPRDNVTLPPRRNVDAIVKSKPAPGLLASRHRRRGRSPAGRPRSSLVGLGPDWARSAPLAPTSNPLAPKRLTLCPNSGHRPK